MKDTTPIYFHSATYAYEHGELDQYHASHKANIACREAIEQAITDNYRDNRLGTACVQQVLQQFDPGRIFYTRCYRYFILCSERQWGGAVTGSLRR